MTDLATIISRIQKLRSLEESNRKNGSLNEAAACAAIVEKLLQEHRLSEAEVEAADPVAPHEAPSEDANPLTAGGQLPAWQWGLASRLGRSYGVAFYISYGRKSVKSTTYPYDSKIVRIRELKMIGRRSDIEIVRYQFSYLCLEVERLTSAFSKAHRFGKGEARTACNSFRLGAIAGIAEAMREAQDAAYRERRSVPGSSAAMVLVDRKREAELALKTLHPKLRSGGSGSGSNINGSAYNDGKRAGASIHRGASLSGGGGVRALGSGK